MTLNASIGLKIAKLRKRHNITQEQLAEKLDISIKHCSSIERGVSSLSLEKLIEVSILFDVSLDYLVKNTSSSENSADDILTALPPSIISILLSQNETEKDLLLEYLQLYTKIHVNQTDEKN